MGTHKIKKRRKKKALDPSQQSNLIQAAQEIGLILNQVRSGAAEILADPDAIRIERAPRPLAGRLRALLARALEPFTGAAQTPALPPAWLYALMSQSFALSDSIAERMGTDVLACKKGRGWNSTDARACEISYDSCYQKSVPFSVTMRDLIVAIREGLSQGAKDAGLQGSKLELISALHVALETPDVEAKWLAGERVFG